MLLLPLLMAIFAFEFIVGVLFAYTDPTWLLHIRSVLWSLMRADLA